MNKSRSFWLLMLAPVCLLGACATNPVTGNPDLVFMSEQDEIRLGRQANQQVLQQYRVYADPELQSYVQYVGEKVAKKSHRPELEYHFTVLDSDEVNAFALPGGYIYITRGLMAYLNNEAELAAVLGHEVGHVTARHAVRQQSATQLANIGAALGSAFIPGLYQAGGQQLVGVLGEAMLRGYGREHELEADRLGAEYLARSGYDPEAMLDVIRVLKAQELLEVKMAREAGRPPRIYHGLFATHPDNDTRLKEVVGAADALKSSGASFLGRTEYLNRIDGLEFGEGTSQGIVRGRDFYHGPLGFALRFPQGWAIRNQNQAVTAAAPSNNAIIQLSVVAADPNLGPREFMLRRMGLRQLGAEQSFKVNGLVAHTATAAVNTEAGPRLARVTVIYFGNSACILAGLTRNAGALGNYDGRFLDTARSFRALTPEERSVANQGQHVHVVRAGTGTSLASLVKDTTIKKYPEEQIRLLNGIYPRGQLPRNELVKTVE